MNKILNSKAPNFNVGDQVICINDNGVNDLYIGNLYKVIDIFIDSNGVYRCHIKNIKSYYGLYCHRFISQLDYDANKYNI